MYLNNNEYPLDRVAFEEWQREQCTQESDDPERFKRLVKKVIQNELDESEKTLVRLYYYDRRNMREIADILSVDPSTVCRRLRNINRKLHMFLKYAAELHFGRGM